MSFKTLLAYQKGFDLAMEVFHMTKSFPAEERFSLISQIVRSSRSVCSSIAEGYRKRQYVKHFKSKLSDADSENSETQLWINFAYACSYISEEKRINLNNKCDEIGRLIHFMMRNPEKFNSKNK